LTILYYFFKYVSLLLSSTASSTLLLCHQITEVNDELQVSLFLMVSIVLTGAGFGYWMVRRFILSKDGSVDAGIAQFVKWAMRVVATFFVMQV